MSAITKGQLVIHEHDTDETNTIIGVVIEPGENMTKILWFDDDEESGWIVSVWFNEEFKVLSENIISNLKACRGK